jgi:glycosyltransferase involved in cell wall biosynthesis
MRDLISIILPVKNGQDTIVRAVNSILNQSYSNLELIVINDHSVDNTHNLVYEIAKIDKRLKIYSLTHASGLSSALNFALFICKGEYIARMDADDISLKDRLKEQISFIKKFDYDLVGGAAVCFDDTSKKIIGFLPIVKTEHLTKKPWSHISIPHPTWLAKKIWFKNHKYKFPEVMLAEDQHLLLNSYIDSNFGIIDKPLILYSVGKFNFFKNLRARKSLFVCHIKYFLINKNFLYLTLSFLNFIFKLLYDFLIFIFPIIREIRYTKRHDLERYENLL